MMTPNLTSADVAQQFNVSRATASLWMRTGRLRSFKSGAVYRTTPAWVDEFVGQHTTDPVDAAVTEVVNEWFPKED